MKNGKNVKRSLLAGLLSVCMLTAIIPVTAAAEDDAAPAASHLQTALADSNNWKISDSTRVSMTQDSISVAQEGNAGNGALYKGEFAQDGETMRFVVNNGQRENGWNALIVRVPDSRDTVPAIWDNAGYSIWLEGTVAKIALSSDDVKAKIEGLNLHDGKDHAVTVTVTDSTTAVKIELTVDGKTTFWEDTSKKYPAEGNTRFAFFEQSNEGQASYTSTLKCVADKTPDESGSESGNESSNESGNKPADESSKPVQSSDLFKTDEKLKGIDVGFEAPYEFTHKILADDKEGAVVFSTEDKHSGVGSLKTTSFAVISLNTQPYAGKTLTFVLWIKGTKDQEVEIVFEDIADADKKMNATKQVVATGEWQRVTVTAKIPENMTGRGEEPDYIKFGIQAKGNVTYTDDWALYDGTDGGVVNTGEDTGIVLVVVAMLTVSAALCMALGFSRKKNRI